MPPRRWRKKTEQVDSQNENVHVDDEHGASFSPPSRVPRPSEGGELSSISSSPQYHLSIVWHKWSDLRLLDHESAYLAHQNSATSSTSCVLHVHFIETPFLNGRARVSGLPRCSPARAQFWKEAVLDLRSELTKRKQGLLVRKVESAEKGFDELFQELLQNELFPEIKRFSSITIFAHEEFCVEEINAERKVRKLCSERERRSRMLNLGGEVDVKIRLRSSWGGLTVHHIDDLGLDVREGEEFPETKGEFNKIAKRRPIRQILQLPEQLKPTLSSCFQLHSNQAFESTNTDIEAMFITHEEFLLSLESHRQFREFYQLNETKEGIKVSHDESYDGNNDKSRHTPPSKVPVLRTADYGCLFQDGSFLWRGGESRAIQYLSDYLENGESLWNYRGATESFAHGEETNPIFSGTRLSPWLAFGCISARYIIHKVREAERKFGKKGGGKSVSKSGSTGARLHTELLFRDFLRFSALRWGSKLFRLGGPYDVGEDISWLYWNWKNEDSKNDHAVAPVNKDSINKDPKFLFDSWRLGQTGYPFVDAGMRQLRATGYMSHLHRQCCAAFLVRDLKLDWRLGAEHFESTLVDYTPDANWGNWAYRILQRPCLVRSRANTFYTKEELQRIGFSTTSTSEDQKQLSSKPSSSGPKSNARLIIDTHISTLECLGWPVVHDCQMLHTLTWVPELSHLPRDLAREPWRLIKKKSSSVADSMSNSMNRENRINVKPYKDSPLYFCAANRTNWDYEYWWLPGKAWLSLEWNAKDIRTVDNGHSNHRKIDIGEGRTYFYPLVCPLNLEINLAQLPVQNHCWGDTPEEQRPHVIGQYSGGSGLLNVLGLDRNIGDVSGENTRSKSKGGGKKGSKGGKGKKRK